MPFLENFLKDYLSFTYILYHIHDQGASVF